MIPLGLPYGDCKKRSTIRTIPITCYCISPNHIMDSLIPDKLKGATDRVIGYDAN